MRACERIGFRARIAHKLVVLAQRLNVVNRPALF